MLLTYVERIGLATVVNRCRWIGRVTQPPLVMLNDYLEPE